MTDQELETGATYVKDRLPDWLERSPATIPSDYFRLGERIVRVEEGLLRVEEAIENQHLLMDKRFEAMEKRFEVVDKRFEDLIHQMDKRFEQISKQVANSFGWTVGIMSVLFLGLGTLITVYQVLGSAGAD